MLMDMSVETETPVSKCVECGSELDRVSGPCAPKPGDLSLCLECGSLNAFADDLSLRPPTDDEILEIAKNSDFQRARRAILVANGTLNKTKQ
jgi:hypothetical protein